MWKIKVFEKGSRKRFPKKVPKRNSIVNCGIVNDDFFISLFNKKFSLRKSDYSPVKIMNFKQIYHIVYPTFQIASEPFSGTFFKNILRMNHPI